VDIDIRSSDTGLLTYVFILFSDLVSLA